MDYSIDSLLENIKVWWNEEDLGNLLADIYALGYNDALLENDSRELTVKIFPVMKPEMVDLYLDSASKQFDKAFEDEFDEDFEEDDD